MSGHTESMNKGGVGVGLPQTVTAARKASVERHECAHCGAVMEWRSVDPGPTKCKSCGAPRKLR